MNLYYIQDSDRPMYVVESSWHHAVDTWKRAVASECDIPINEVDEPKGITFLADSSDIILPEGASQ